MDELAITAGLSLARALAFPRLCGTPGERRAAQILQACFRELGWQQTAQRLLITNAIVINLKAIVLLCAIASVLSWLAAGLYLICAVLLGIVSLTIARDIWWRSASAKTFGIRPRRVAESVNWFFVAPQQEKPAMWLCAHYDSKAQTLPLVARMLVSSMLLGCVLFSLAAAFISLLTSHSLPAVLQKVTGMVALGCAVPLLAVRTTNKSAGALDNAGSVAAAYALAKAWQQSQPSTPPFGVVLTTGEEWGLAGGHAAAEWLAEKYPGQQKPVVINLEGIGASKEFLWRLPPKRLQRQAQHLVSQLRAGRKERLLRLLPVAAADHLAFWRHGISAVTLFAFGNKLRHVHTPTDTHDKIDGEAFEYAVRQLSALVQKSSQTTVNR